MPLRNCMIAHKEKKISTHKTYCSFNKNFAGLLILMQCINKLYLCDIELRTNGVEASKGWVFIAHFSIYSSSRCRCHAGTDILRLRGHTLQISQVVRTARHWISCCAPTIGNVMRECKIGKSSPHQPCENTCHSNVLELSSLPWMARALACF